MAKKTKVRKKPVTMDQVLYQLDRGRLAVMMARINEVIMSQNDTVAQVNSSMVRSDRNYDDCQEAMTDLLHRIVALERAKKK